MIKAIIFDMDDLMIDSERVTFECYQEIIKPMNLTMDEAFYKTLLGKPIKGIYERFYDTYGKDFPIDDIIKDVHALMAKRFETEGVPIKKGLLVLLNYLKENAEQWANKILEIKNFERKDVSKTIKEKGYDIKENAKKLEEKYRELVKSLK